MARGWKRVAEWVLARSGVARRLELRGRPSTTVLAYHNIVPRGEQAAGDMSLHVDQDAFAEQLDFILERHRVISLEDLGVAQQGNGGDLNKVAITFDDAYVGTMTAGLEELSKRGLPATVFVPPGLLASSGFWWDRLAPAGAQPLRQEVREHALGTLQGRTEAVLAWSKEEGLPLQSLPPHSRPTDVDHLRDTALASGITFGAHTWSHPNLEALPATEVAEELQRSRDGLRAVTDRYVDWLAYPYGLCNSAAVSAAERTFTKGSLLISGGAAEWRGHFVESLHRVPRVNVPRGLTLEGLALRFSGLA